nr:MAG TPA: hypothetical protein [Caudoviricetes sp.]
MPIRQTFIRSRTLTARFRINTMCSRRTLPSPRLRLRRRLRTAQQPKSSRQLTRTESHSRSPRLWQSSRAW